VKSNLLGGNLKNLSYVLIILLSAVPLVTIAQPLPRKLPFPPPQPGFTLADLDRVIISGTPYMTTRAAIRQALEPVTKSGLATHSDTFSAATDAAVETADKTPSQLSSSHLRFQPNFVVSENQLSADLSRDVEPTTIVQQYGSANYRTTVATKFASGVPSNYYYTTDGSLNWAQSLAGPQAGYNWQGNLADYHALGDPYLSENIYSSGIAGKRMYSVGIAYSGTAFSPPTGIALWSSDDGGRTWSYPIPVASTTTASVLYDKPSVAVSWYSGTGSTLGEVYVAYVYARQSGVNDIHVARSWNGGLNFFQDVVIASGAVSDPQMLVDGRTGYLYVVWEDFNNPLVAGNDRIWYRSSTDLNHLGQDGYWNPSAIAVDNQNLIPPPGLVHFTRMATEVIARLNTSAGMINIVWHGIGANGTPDIFFGYKLTSQTNWNFGALQGAGTDNDQFQPALDFDAPNGNLIIGYYSRTGLANGDTNYREYTVLVRSDGTTLRAEEPLSSFYTDANFDNGDGYAGFVGDYHEIWFSPEFAYWFDAWIGRNSQTTGWYEVYRSGVY
jgi:hypothetical protein